jgi:hypothetical protein
MSCHFNELQLWWVATSMSCCFDELLLTWVAALMSCHFNELLLWWVAALLICCCVDLLFWWVASLMSCCFDDLLFRWVTSSVSCCFSHLPPKKVNLYRWRLIEPKRLIDFLMNGAIISGFYDLPPPRGFDKMLPGWVVALMTCCLT